MKKVSQLFDACVICALPEEARAFLEVVQQHCEGALEERISPLYRYSYRSAILKNDKDEPLNLHISWLPRYGPQEMTLHLSHVLEECQPRIAIMTGICAGDAQQVQLGDLVVAERTFTYDNGKFTIDEHGRSVHRHDTMTYQLDANILQFLGLFDNWKPLVAGLQRPPSAPEQRQVACHLKAMASGNAVRTDHPFEDVQAPVRGTVAIDMEGAAFGLVMSRHPLIRWLVVKGVCDYADQTKSDAYHDHAARASALYALSFLRVYVTNERLPRLDRPSNLAEPDDLPASDTQQLPQAQKKSARLDPFPPVWNVPYRYTPFFTGRDHVVEELFRNFTAVPASGIIPVQALTGLGGLGKTQTAVAYAFRYRTQYQTVLWIKAETEGDLLTSFTNMARLLALPGTNLQQRESVLDSIQRWFSNTADWLLILDNADNLAMVAPFLPIRLPNGHLLLTTRATATGGLAQPQALTPLQPEDGALCILRRANYIPWNVDLSAASPRAREAAQTLSQLVGGLPLALEQAGAYIEATGRGVSGYLELYEKYRPEIQKNQYGDVRYYRTAVAFAWNLAREVVQLESPAAIELLYLCAYLSPDAIFYQLFPKDASILGPTLGPVAAHELALDLALTPLRKHSLIKNEVDRDTDIPRIFIHRVLQEVLRDGMDPETQRLWAERAVRVVALALPLVEWPILQAHVQACLPLIEQWKMSFREADTIRQYVEAKHM
jgi:nucleoside phosphorylase